MSETTCPVCRAKCIEVKTTHCSLCDTETRYHSLPTPDLTKLREAHQYLTVNRGGKHEEDAINELLWEVKEVLGE